MGEQQEQQQLQQEEDHKNFSDSSKRKLEDTIELAKQKVQEIASRLVSDADSKRPRLNSDNLSDSSSLSNSISAPPIYPVAYAAQPSQHYGLQGMTKRISIPNGKVGVVIGKGGETIKYIQLQSGAKIQITKDHDADPHSLTRDVELMGTSEQISRAEQLIDEVIAETDAGCSASSAVGLSTKQSDSEQFSMTVPNDKVGLLIGKGGETIKYMQSKSGARMQIIPLHLPPGDTSTERTVYINGSTEQIEAAKELINDVISGKRIINPSTANSHAQPVYPPPGNWAQPGQPPMQQPQYGYMQPGPPFYSNYSSHQPGWDQSNLSTISQTPQQASGYGYYGQQPQMGSASVNPSYSYSQAPVAGTTYDQAYSQQPPSYGQSFPNQDPPMDQQHQQYATSSYGPTALPSQPDGAISSQSTQSAPTYPPPAYSQPVANPQAHWNSSSFTGQPPAQAGYDQTSYSQTAYGGLQPGQIPPTSTQPVYGQGGYPLPPTSGPANYVQGTHSLAYGQQQLETQPQSQPPSNGVSQSLVYGADAHDGNSNAGHGSDSASQEAAPAQS